MTIAPSENGWKKIDGIDGTEAAVGGESRKCGVCFIIEEGGRRRRCAGADAGLASAHRRSDEECDHGARLLRGRRKVNPSRLSSVPNEVD